jgi:hydrogenase expression/formation protein HypE
VPLPGPALGLDRIRAGDEVLVSGPIGDHGTAVLLAREAFGLRGDLKSDCASVLPLVRAIRALEGLRFMRDPTRGGLASVAHEIVRATQLGVELDAATVPVRPPVQSVCSMLGYDPYYLACEGRIVAVVDPADRDRVLAAWRALPDGAEAACIGTIVAGTPRVTLRTPLGGKRLLEELEDDPLPRIC